MTKSKSIREAICVIPCYNESTRFDPTYWKNLTTSYKYIDWYFVNDGSTDNTASVLLIFEELKLENVHIVNLPQNVGKGNAIRFGLLQAISCNSKARVALYVDSDGAFSGEDIIKIVNIHLEELEIDCVLCSRIKLSGRSVKRSNSRHFLGRIVATLIGLNWNDAPYDTQTGLKSFRVDDNLKNAIENSFATRWFFDLELLIRLEVLNQRVLRIWEEPASTWRDVDGSKMNTRQRILALGELIRVLQILRKRRPV